MTTQNKREMTLEERLADERILFLLGQIDTRMAGGVIMRLLEMAAKSDAPIKLYIFSPGGEVGATLAIYDTIQFLKCDVSTVCVGQACSGAAIILLAGTKGQRQILSHGEVMLHQPWGGVTGQAADIKIQAEQINKQKAILNQIVADHTGQDVGKVKDALERDNYMTAEEAKAFGIVDEIISNPTPKATKTPKPEEK